MNCIYNKTNFEAYKQLKTFRKILLSDKETVSISDFGSGSKVLKTDTRTVSQIARTSGSTLKKAKLLYRLSHYLKPSAVLELGTSVGIGTMALALGCQKSKITSIEGAAALSKIAEQQLHFQNISNVEFRIGEFKDELPQLEQQVFDLIFFDGHHNEQATMDYFDLLLPTKRNNSVWVFDDIYWSKGMTKAWERIISHEQVNVSIDLFHFGIVFFRQEQAKEHFKIRF